MLDRLLVGKVGQLGGKGMSFAAMFKWVQHWWKASRKAEVRPLGDQAFLFVFTLRKEAELMLCQRWIVDGRDLLLEWWSPLALCRSKDIVAGKKCLDSSDRFAPSSSRGRPVSRVFSTLRDGFGPYPIDWSSPVVCASLGLAERSPIGPRQSSGSGVNSGHHFVPEEALVGSISSATRTVAMGDSAVRLQQGVNEQDHWADLVDGLAIVVRPEVVKDDVVLDTAACDDDDLEDDFPKENFYSGDGIPQLEEVSAWVLSCINELSINGFHPILRAIAGAGGSKIQEVYLIFQDFSEKYQMTSLILNGKAVCCMHMGNFDEAESLLLEALNKDAKDPETLANLIVCSLHLGKPSSRFVKVE
ncbi:Coatomer subunit epsilon-1 [Camellia lanceoleosa]|uniref:Coatomer subunit epsilon-1 n=1 Tax=Camellia lanceoleosa TaxID=1840588 RepID=A0ACC0GNM8_9ERIC|nr:Coatomer subunit epsilon-1 [Camellia lanceoleosa]